MHLFYVNNTNLKTFLACGRVQSWGDHILLSVRKRTVGDPERNEFQAGVLQTKQGRPVLKFFEPLGLGFPDSNPNFRCLHESRSKRSHKRCWTAVTVQAG